MEGRALAANAQPHGRGPVTPEDRQVEVDPVRGAFPPGTLHIGVTEERNGKAVART